MLRSAVYRLKERARRLPPYGRTRRFILESERWTPDALAGHQRERLRELVRRAHRRSPYYRRLLEERFGGGLDEGALAEIALERLPRLTRERLRGRAEELRISGRLRPTDRRKTTSGTSTGVPLAFYEDFAAVPREHAFLTDLWSRIGYRVGDRVAVLRGNVVAGDTGGRPWAQRGRHLLLSSYHLTPEHAGELLDALRRFRPRWLHVYPSTLAAFCRLVPRRRCRRLGVRGVLAGSEKLYEGQRALFEDYFGARVMHWYGMTEKVLLAGECEESTKLHVYPQYGRLETEPVDEEGRARVLGTSFVQSATPFIRYDTGDVVRLAAERYCRHCGRPYPLIEEVTGRAQEFVVAKHGAVLPFSEAVGSIHGRMWDGIERWRVVQERPGEIVFQAHSPDGLDRDRAAAIEGEFGRRFGTTLDVDVMPAELDDPGPGKYRYFVQHLDVERYR